MAKNKKENVKKENVKKESEKEVKVQKSDSFGICSLLAPVLIIVVSLGAFHIFTKLTYVPDLPKVDLDKWWGPNGTEANQDTSIRPFRVIYSDAMLEEQRKKFDLYRGAVKKKSFPDEPWTYGMHSDAVGHVFAHWQFKYKSRERVRFLNKFDHFKTNIQGLDIHFIHVKPKVKKDSQVHVIPILLLHGWPSSVREFYDAIPSLIKERPGYDFVFEVIAPSLPGFFYSQGTTKQGLNTIQIAVIMRNLMQRLSFNKYVVQGGDFGHSIGSHLATLFPEEVIGFHTNFPVNFSKLSTLASVFGAIWPKLIDSEHSDRMYPLTDKTEYFLEESGYMHLQSTKPDTIGIALQDSPMGLAAYIIERFMIFTDPNNKNLEDGGFSKYFNLTDLLDNVMMYWISNSITTSLRLYKECVRSSEVEQVMAQIPTKVPTWGLRTKHELLYQPDFILRWKYPNLTGSTILDKGGHYAAFEKPKVFADDLFKAVNSFVGFHSK